MADNPQETIRELRELVVAYAKQETVEPLKGLGRYVGYGLAGALLFGIGITFLGVGVLRVLQDETSTALTGNWSWVPYGAAFSGMLILALGAFMQARRRTSKKESKR